METKDLTIELFDLIKQQEGGSLVNLTDDFYLSVFDRLRKLKDSESPEYSNALKLVKKLYERRMREVILLALERVQIGGLTGQLYNFSALTEEERRLFSQCLELFNSNYMVNELNELMRGLI